MRIVPPDKHTTLVATYVLYEDEVIYKQTFDVQNRMVTVRQSSVTTVTKFTYGDGEIRVATIAETPEVSRTVTYYPFPNYEEELIQTWQEQGGWGPGPSGHWVTLETIRRSTYSIAGQTIAVRVSGHPESGNNGIFYMLTDHLGSTTMLAYGNDHPPQLKGKKVPGSEAAYLPYGGYRATPTTEEITDRGFTGHRHNDGIGLIYMRARYYVPGVGRFASADSIVPNPQNPQSYNRYSYTNNSPLLFTDPSGHRCENRDYDYADEEWECYEMEQEILDSTVTIEVDGYLHIYLPWIGEIYFPLKAVLSHATVFDDQTLISHGHFPFSPDEFGMFYEISSLRLFSSEGEEITPTDSSFGHSHIWIDGQLQETTILTFGSGTFNEQRAASFITRGDPLPAAGNEIAMVNWTGEIGTEFVDWDQVEWIGYINGIYSVQTIPGLSKGASGAGYFSNGKHFANHLGGFTQDDGQYVGIGSINPLTVNELP